MKRLIRALFGRRYYINICNDMATDFIASTPFESRREAQVHQVMLIGNRSVRFVRTVSFRTRRRLDVKRKG